MSKITDLTKREIVDTLNLEGILWNGRLDESAFLERLYKLAEMRSTDGRFKNAAGDIWQHRVRNSDWEDDWVFHDSRFQLLNGDDETFLRFLCETVHPVVRNDKDEIKKLLSLYNDNLKHDGYELYESGYISGRPVFGFRETALSSSIHLNAIRQTVEKKVDALYISQQIVRMEAAVSSDADLAIGTAKELIETSCKTILSDRGIAVDKNWDLPQLVKTTAKELKLTPEDIPDDAKSVETIRRILGNLASVAHGLAELRNQFGTGHGKAADAKGLTERHAKLAVGAASTLSVFLFETHSQRSST
jgi:hypothetical protein